MRLGPATALLFLLVAAQLGHAGEDARGLTPADLPPGWSIVREVVVPPAQLAGFASRLGGKLDGLANQHLSINGLQAQANTLTAATDADAEAVHGTMVRIRGDDFVRRAAKRVYEVTGQNRLLASRIFAVLGLPAERRTYDVAFRKACLDDLDYARGNEVFNLFLELEKAPADEQLRERIRGLTKGWTRGQSVRLLDAKPPSFAATWELVPAARGSELVGDLRRFDLEAPPEELGIPYVDVRGRLRVSDRFTPDGAGTPEGLTGATAWWPADHEEIVSLAKRLTSGEKTPRERVLALLAHVGRAVSYGGRVGSRDGVEAVLERGLGRCWDKSDVLVTLCRAAGIPARQVAGWVPALEAGHIWAEVHLAGEGWLPVDATCTWLGVSAEYIPFTASNDGAMPVVYLSMPQIRRVD